MSKKGTNSKSDLKKVLDRNRHKEEMVAEKVDMQSRAEYEIVNNDSDDYNTAASMAVQNEQSSTVKVDQKDDIDKRDSYPLSEEEKEEYLEVIREKCVIC